MGASRDGRNIIAAIVEGRGTGAEIGMCFCDLRTSEVILSQICDSFTYVNTLYMLNLCQPTEILLAETALEPTPSKLAKAIQENCPGSTITAISRRFFSDRAEQSTSFMLGIASKYFCLSATAAAMKHMEESRNSAFINHSVQFKYRGCRESMLIDSGTARNLELTVNLSSQDDQGTLFGVLNQTLTPMGNRLLRTNILQPSKDKRAVSSRLDSVELLSRNEELFYSVREVLKSIPDVDHLITSFVQEPSRPTVKVSEQAINNVIILKHTLRTIELLAQPLAKCTDRLLESIHNRLSDPRLARFTEIIDQSIEPNTVYEKKPVALRNQRCFAVKARENGLLDVARLTYKETIEDMFEVVNGYAEQYAIILKVQFNTNMGYHLSTTTDLLNGRPLPLIFVNVVRRGRALSFTSLDLIKKNAKIEDSLTEVYMMSDAAVKELACQIRADIGALYKASEAVAMLDMLSSFAYQCTVSDYVRPNFTDTMAVKQGRHPIIERLHENTFVPNDIYASYAHTFQIITGPNMSGKSTYLRQVALLCIMAQIGSFVPAEYATFRIMDQVFSRICNDDNIELNASTFMVEMKETAYILQNVSDKCLVIMDELGRAYAVCEELIQIKAIVFFATHFQELAHTLEVYHNVVNMHLETELTRDDEQNPGLSFKYRVTQGFANEEHYGLLLAKAIQFPQDITDRAEQVSRQLLDLAEANRTKARSQSVVYRRRCLSELAHRLILLQQHKNQISRKELVQSLREMWIDAVSGVVFCAEEARGEDSSPVSILCFDCVRQKDKLPLARNAFKKFRTIRHPDLIKYIDGVETESYIYIVTDAVTPLQDHLRSNLDPNLIRWGLYKVANVLKFLTVDASFIHGNIRISSIFITKSGEWKVGGFEALSSLKEELPTILVYNGTFSNPEQLSTPGNIPPEMAPFYKNLLRPDPKSRPSVGDFLDKGLQARGFFQNDLIQVVLFLENFSVKEPLARDAFLRKLDMQIDRFPKEFCKYKVLPELVHALEYGSGGAKVLAPIIKIGSDLEEHEYEALISNVLVKMFASTDRTIRLSLLENLGGFIDRINKKIVNEKIFPSMALGFTDTAPIIREWTVKSVLLVIGKLSDRVINYDLLKYLGKLQTDEEPGIRTNTVICLGKIAKYLNDGTKGKILVPAFTRSLRDPFAHARVASLMALNATSDSYDKGDIASRIIPCVSLTLIDTEKIVRVQAMKTLETFTKRIEKLVESMPDSAIVASENTGRESPSGRAATPSTPSSETWAGWAVSSITKKLVTGEMQPQAVSPQPSSSPSPANTPVPTTGSNGMSLGGGAAVNGLQIAASSSNSNGHSVNRYSSALAAVEADEATNDESGWGNEDDDLFADNGFEPMESFEPSTPSPMPSFATMKPTVPAAPLRPSTNASSSMALGGGAKPSARLGFGAMESDAWGGDDDDLINNLIGSRPNSMSSLGPKPVSYSPSIATGSAATPPKPATGFVRNEEKAAEMARKREERRQRMAEAKEKKQSTLGARKI
ncbi:MutS protein msh4 [Podila clonocystis]|nr:MutS protein msh4 [Podila clonocystis]